MKMILKSLIMIPLFTLVTSSCGRDDKKDDAPPPAGPAAKKEAAFALQSGQYSISDLTNIQDGCGKDPMNAKNPITNVPFTLSNDGTGKVTVDFCSAGAEGVQGVIQGNQGTLNATHPNRRVGAEPLVAVFDQQCQVDITVTADNEVKAHYAETQGHRNQALRDATANVSDCTTAFDFKMHKQS